MFTELLAESEFPAQGIFFIIVLIFSFLKWLFNKLTHKNQEAEPEILESLYDQYREEIIQRQTAPSPPPVQHTPPAAPVPSTPPALPVTASPKSDNTVNQRLKATQDDPKISGITEIKLSQSDNSVIRKKLRSKDGLRQAIIARQILGPPKALSGQKF